MHGASLKRQAVQYGIGYAVSRLQTFIMLPIIAKYLAPADYGVVENATTFALVFTLVASLGLDSALSATYYKHSSSEQLSAFSTAFQLTLSTSVGLFALTCFFSHELGKVIFGYILPDYLELVLLAAGLGVAKAALQLHTMYLRLNFKPVSFNVVLFTESALSLLLAACIARWTDWGAGGIIAVNLVGTAAACLVCLWLNRTATIARPSRKLVGGLLAIGVPFLPYLLSVLAVTMLNRIIGAQQLSLAEVGILGAAARIASVVNLVLAPFQLAWWTYSLSRWKTEDPLVQFPMIYRQFLVFGGGMVLALAVLAPLLSEYILPVSYIESGKYVGLIAAGLLLSCLFYFPQTTLVGQHRTGLSSVAMMGALLLSFATAVGLTPVFGVAALALSPIVGFGTALVIGFFFAYRLRPIRYPLGGSVLLLVVLLGVVTVPLWHSLVFSGRSAHYWLAVGGISVYLGVGWLLGFRPLGLVSVTAFFRSGGKGAPGGGGGNGAE